MMINLAWQSLRNRGASAILTIVSIALAVALFLGVEKVRTDTRESFLRNVAGTDLIVAARGGQLQTLLFAVFHTGTANANISADSMRRIARHPLIEWTVPISLGDSYQGNAVVATDTSWPTYMRTASGEPPALASGRWFECGLEAVLGSRTAEELGLSPGQEIVLAHGAGAVSFHDHGDHPFTIVGTLAATGTPSDQALFISLQSMHRLHAEAAADIDNSDEAGAQHADHTGHREIQQSADTGHEDHRLDHDDEDSHDRHPPQGHVEHDHGSEGSHEPHLREGHGEHDHESEDGHDPHTQESHGEHDHVGEHDNEAYDDGHTGERQADHDDQNHGPADHQYHEGHDHDGHCMQNFDGQLSAFFTGVRDPGALLTLQRAINEYPGEPLTAVLPGLALQELWNLLGVVETALRAVSALVILAGLLGMATAILSSINERRRELAILRSVGAGPSQILLLILLEAALYGSIGALVGIILVTSVAATVQDTVATHWGIYLTTAVPVETALTTFAAVTLAAILAGVVPAALARRRSLLDGLTVRT